MMIMDQGQEERIIKNMKVKKMTKRKIEMLILMETIGYLMDNKQLTKVEKITL